MKIIILISMLFLSGCTGLLCFERGQRSCDRFLCLHPVDYAGYTKEELTIQNDAKELDSFKICNGEPLTNAEIRAGVKQ